MQINKADIEDNEICKRNEVTVINSKPNLGIMEDDDDIPEWLLIEVLIRLDVKLIFRFKLVCKHWLSVISDPSFVRMYISRVSLFQPSQPWVIVSRVMFFDCSKCLDFFQSESVKNIYSREFRPPSYCLLQLPSTQQPQRENFEIYGISNGLVLFAPIVPKSDASLKVTAAYNICNPVTGQKIVLPPITCQPRNDRWGFLTKVEDGMLKSYRVVCLDWSFPRTRTIRFRVFFSESGEWKDFSACSDQQIESMWAMPPTDFHGNLHWVFRNGILAYDPYQKPDDFRIIALPHDKDDKSTYQPREKRITRLCGVSDGKLRYLELSSSSESPYGFSSFSVWILNDYSSGDWSLQNRISHVDFTSDAVAWCPNSLILPLALDPNDSDIVYLGCVNVISISYNITTKRFETHGQPLNNIQIVDRIREIIDLDPYFGFGKYSALDKRFGDMFMIPLWPTLIPHSLSISF